MPKQAGQSRRARGGGSSVPGTAGGSASRQRPEPEKEVLLVVCRANVARSPLAAGMLRERLDRLGRKDIVVVSAGLDATPGDSAAPEALAVAQAHGIDLAGHRATPVSAAQLSAASLVVTMTEADRAAVVRLTPSAVPRTFTLPELVRLLAAQPRPLVTCAALAEQAHRARPRTVPADGPEDVPDPVGRPQKHYERLADRLADGVEKLGAHLLPRP